MAREVGGWAGRASVNADIDIVERARSVEVLRGRIFFWLGDDIKGGMV